MTIANKLARPELVEMVAYQSARRGQSGGNCWLNANEAPGTGQYQLNSFGINRYPDFQPTNLINAYSNYAGVEPNQILASRGADEGIDVLIRTFCRAHKDKILICPPTYGMYAISAQTQGCEAVTVPLIGDHYQLDTDSIAKSLTDVKLVFICSPNNPTGHLIDHHQIKQVLEQCKDRAIVVVDEAYIEFCPEQTVVSWLKEYSNLVILRTLSKAYALAGLRCGFTLASTDIIAMMSKVIAPYPIAAPVAEIASDALNGDGITTMTIRVKECNKLKEDFTLWLEKQSWCDEVFNSDANFILLRSKQAKQIFNCLSENGLLIRDQSKQYRLENCLRISIGSANELALVKNTLATQEDL